MNALRLRHARGLVAAARPWLPALLCSGLLLPGLAGAADATSGRARKSPPAANTAAAPAGISRPVPHPATRATATPTGGCQVAVNPPALLWPTTSLGGGHYAVRLSRDRTFPEGATQRADSLRWAMFNPHQTLTPGTWYWQHAVVRAGQSPAWSDVHTFSVRADARPFVTPPSARMLAAIPPGHPRILARADELPALRAAAAGRPEIEALLARARRLVSAALPRPDQAKASQAGATAFETKNFAKWAAKGFAGEFAQDLTTLAPAYLLTGDTTVGRAAVARARLIADLDPDGDTAPGVSDFADGSCMRTMALAYDSCFDLLTPGEREQLRQAMRIRAGRFFQQHVNRLEGRIFNAHVWQHILLEAAEIAWATLHELPEASQWAAYVYELWLNRFPPLGGDDGGWTEGIGYLGTNLETLLLMPQRLGQLTGVDFLAHPWYQNAPYYHLYGWPPGSVNAGFGDGDHDAKAISAARAYFVETLGRRSGSAAALDYARRASRGGTSQLPPLLAWHRLRDRPPAAPATAGTPPLPLSRAFRDVGLALLHTDLANARRNVFVAHNACPYGAYGHMHPAQNAFNLMLGGQRLFANSGYYIAYGDAHFKGWYHHSRGHNTVLIDGRGQVADSTGWGWLARHADNGTIAYSLGDASPAYGDAGLTRFRRHVALLRPSTIVIYDELAADHPAQWSWLLHSPARLRSEPAGARLHARLPTGQGRVDLLGPFPLRVAVDDRFDPPADNWRGRRSGREVIQYANQWHATVEPDRKTPHMRYLALIQLRLRGDAEAFHEPVREVADQIRLGPWTVRAALDPAMPASLVITHAEGTHALATDTKEFEFGGTRHAVSAGETLLIAAGRTLRTRETAPE